MSATPFHVRSCALIVRMEGLPSAINLRELRDRVERCSPSCLYHHFVERLIRPTFDDPEFTNDFAAWAYRALGDTVLAERLGVLDPFSADSIEVLRSRVSEILEERLAEADHVPSVDPGKAFYFTCASMAVFDTGMRINEPSEILGALQRMTRASIYFHFVEGRFRRKEEGDDFSAWLRSNGGLGERLAASFSGVDVAFFSLRSLRDELVQRSQRVLEDEAERSQ